MPGRVYFGPYSDARRARKLLEVLPSVFPFRSCSGVEPGRRTGNPCLDYHIGLCLAPCVGKIDKRQYRRGIDRVVDFLSGRRRAIEKAEEEAMNKAARNKEFERAALHRDRLLALRALGSRNGDWGNDKDVLGAFCDKNEAALCILEVREGIISEQRDFLLQGTEGKTEEEIEREFSENFSNTTLPKQEGKLLDMARRRARIHLLQDRRNRASQTLSAAEAMAQLGEVIGQPPFRIEGYDVANLHGENIVGTMVVFEGGQRKRSHYRTFRIKGKERPDDYASLREVIERRVAAFHRMQDISPYDPDWDESFAALPDLLLVDGGRGQLSAVLDPASKLLKEGCSLLALAKKKEEVFSPDGPVDLLPTSQGSMLLQRVRDEAHRTSNARHRALRKKDALASPLDEVSGIGPSRKKALIEHFGSTKSLARASAEEIAALPGITKEMARDILRALAGS